MATVYSSEVAVGSYNRIRIKCDYSGTSATLTVQFRRTSAWTDTWRDDTATLVFNGQTKPAAYNYSGTVPASSDWSNPITLVTVSGYTISTSGGTYSWKFNNPQEASVLGCSGNITVPGQGSAPSGGSITDVTPGTNSITMTGGVSSIGTGGSSTNVELVVLNAPYTQGGVPQRYERFHTLTDTKTITNSSPAANGGITISPNTQYYIGVYASNGALDYRYNGGTTVTLAEAPTVTVASTTTDSVTVSYSTTADGGYHNKTIKYSIDGGTTWETAATVATGSATTGTFTITGLSASTSYNLQIMSSTTSGDTEGTAITITTSGPKAVLYGSVSDQTTKIKRLYCSVNGETRRVKRLYASVSGVARIIYGG